MKSCVLLQNVSYIGLTSTTLSRRLTCHLSSGAPKNHLQLHHGIKISRTFLEDNVKILGHLPNKNKLIIAEALLIEEKRPSIHIQHEEFDKILKLFN